ncbi:hypothetical protein [Actinacidiphila rubida]|uniref:Uncharacterized protein n=1 Tax=Actinacidiphila rubida TaxID=310780 RepID=A0A1H8TGL5_9ACTN|nr:hypothetical protein [Actinacidiphila rubida]SEO90240.1 hypothetical protein SAMN05216267_105321 [Actinacidiphila rubida]
MSATEIPRGESGPRYVRLQAELVLEVTAAEELRASALSRIEADTFMPQQERDHARSAVGHDESEALAYLVDPSELVADLPGIELVQASWSCAHTEYDPDEDDDWGMDEDDERAGDDEDDDEADDEGAEGAGGAGGA